VNEFPQSKDPTLQSEALDLKDVDSWSQEWKEQAEWVRGGPISNVRCALFKQF